MLLIGIFLTVLSLTAAGSLGVLLVLGMKKLFGKRLGARWNYLVWLLPLALYLVPVYLPQGEHPVRKAPQVLLPAAGAPAAVPKPVVPGGTALVGGTPAIFIPDLWELCQQLLPALALLWLLGLILSAAVRLADHRRLARSLEKCSHLPEENGRAAALFSRLLEEMNIPQGRVELWLCPGVESPLLLGLWRPRVILPEEDLPEERLEMMLRHELNHYRGRDLWLKAIALVAATFPKGDVKNKVLEFAGPGVKELSADYRIGIDVMTTETSCLSSIWETDETIRRYYENVGRPEDFRELKPQDGAYYDSVVKIDLSRVECMIALPFHPSIAYTVHELQADPERIFAEVEEACNKQLGGKVTMDLRRNIVDGKVTCDQGVIVGCSGGMYENIVEAARILEGGSIGNGYFDMSVYPSSTPISLAITKNGVSAKLMEAGCVMKPAFCGPCFGAGDTPANQTLSIRHATRNFANREGSKPGSGQIAAVALMDARSIAATARNGGVLTAATDIAYESPTREELAYRFDGSVYAKRCYEGFGKADPGAELRYGPNIKDWPQMPKLEEDLLVQLCAVIHDPVTTTDELIPSGETSSYRSNPIGLSEFALSRRVPEYVARSKAVRALEEARQAGEIPDEVREVLDRVGGDARRTTVGSCIFARKPGDGSAREQAASCQKVLGGFANICYAFATKRYRSNCINWGIVPFTMDAAAGFPYEEGDWVYIPGVKKAVAGGVEDIPAKVIRKDGTVCDLALKCAGLTADERLILQEGCLMNYYAAGYGK